MKPTALSVLSPNERHQLLDLFAAVLWQDGHLGRRDRFALRKLTRELGEDPCSFESAERVSRPPPPHRVDPARIPRRLRPLALSLCQLAAQIAPSFARFECVELLRELLTASPQATTVATQAA